MSELRIDNVIRTFAQGVEQYLGFLSARTLGHLLTVKPFDDPSGEGYQRSANVARVRRMRRYLKDHRQVVLPTILLNTEGRWEFTPYSPDRPDHGYLVCHGPASIIDGQHRIEGIRRFIGRSKRKDILVPFQALANLSSHEEIEAFQTINSQARPITKSHIQFLRRHQDEMAWVAVQVVQDPSSPLAPITSVEGVRRRDKGVRLTLQYVQKAVNLMCEGPKMQAISKEDKARLILGLFQTVRHMFPEAWEDFRNHRLTHTVGLYALAKLAGVIFEENIAVQESGEYTIDLIGISEALENLRGFDWSVQALGSGTGAQAVNDLYLQLMTQHVRRSMRKSS